MDDPGVDFRASVRAQVAAQEFIVASDNLAASRSFYEREQRVLRVMLILEAMGTALFLSFSIYIIATKGDAFRAPEGASGPVIALTWAITIAVFLLMSLWIGSILPGFVGMWRAISRSGFFVWGGVITLMIILVLFCWIALMFGPVFLARQAWRTRKAKRALAGAEERYQEACTAVA